MLLNQGLVPLQVLQFLGIVLLNVLMKKIYLNRVTLLNVC